MKKIIIFVMALVLLIPGTVFASENENYREERVPRFIDEVGLLTEQEAAKLNDRLDEVSGAYGIDTVVFVVESLGGWGARELAAEMYEKYDFGMDAQYSGIMLLLSMEDRDYGLAATGRGTEIFTPSKQEDLKSKFLPYFKENDYYGGFMAYANGVNDFIVQHDTGLPSDSGSDSKPSPAPAIIWSLIIALVIALIVTGVLRGQLKSIRPENFATAYIRQGSMIVTNSIDRFRYRNVTMTAKPTDNDSGSSFSSSSGRSYSGSSGKF